jgi:competence protein ComEC
LVVGHSSFVNDFPMTIIYLGVAWFLGIWLGQTLAVSSGVWLGGTAVATLTAVLLRSQPPAPLILACVAALCLGGARYQAAVPLIDENHIAFYNDQDAVILFGVVDAEPDVRDDSLNVRLRAGQLVLADGVIREVDGLVLLNLPRYPLVEYGSRLRLQGQLVTPPANPEFSYRDYLARHGVHSLMSRPQLEIRPPAAGGAPATGGAAADPAHAFYHALLAFKQRAQATINSLLPDPYAALLSAILLGNRGGLAPELVAAFRTTGLSHLTVVSGFHVTILVAALAAVTTPLLGRRRAIWPALAALFLYTLLVGAGPSVQRAAVMGATYLLATRLLGRPVFAPASLVTAAMLMSLRDPLILWEVGFQLSFGATLGIMLYAQPMNQFAWSRLARRLGPTLTNRLMQSVGEVVIISLAAQILTLPLITVYFGQLSLITLLSNALVIPAQPGAMIGGGLAALAGMVWLPLGQLLAWLAWPFLAYTVVVVEALALIPGAAVPVYVSHSGALALFGLLLLLTWLVRQRPAERLVLWQRLAQNVSQRLVLAGAALTAVLVLAWGHSQPDGYLHVAFLDVGHGDALFIQTPAGRQVLVDGGRYPSLLYDRLGRQMPFWDRRLDLVVVSATADSYAAALPGVFGRYRVDQILTGATLTGSPLAETLRASALRAGAPIHYALAGETIILDQGVTLETLYPAGASDHEATVVLRLVYGRFSLLLTGAAAGPVEAELVDQGRPLASLVLKAGRHGATTATTDAFLTAVQPQIVVISSGQENRAGDPQAELLARIANAGAVVLRTDELGVVTVKTDGELMWWQARR